MKPAAVLIFLTTVAVVQLWSRVPTRVPGMLAALLATTLIVHFFGLDVETIQSRFGDVPRSLPSFRLLEIDWDLVPKLVSPAITIALLAAIESLLSAVVADGLIGGRHRSNASCWRGTPHRLPLLADFPATARRPTATRAPRRGSPVAGSSTRPRCC